MTIRGLCLVLGALLGALLAGCVVVAEGDEPGECTDDADNDRDGLFDCDDPDCAGASACDEPGDDDDATGDDDDSSGDDDDATGDDDDSGPVLQDAPLDLIEITAPNWGYDLATTATTITIEGIARDDVTAVTWATGSGGGAAAGTATWAAQDIPLVTGDNVVTITATNGTDTQEATLRVTSNPGVPIVSDLSLSQTVVLVGEPADVTAAVWLEPGTSPDAHADGLVRLATSDTSGAMVDVWAELTESTEHPGLWSGTFSADVSLETTAALRAYTTVGGVQGSTPDVQWQVRAPLTEAEWTSAEEVAFRAQTAFDDAGGQTDPAAGQAGVVAQLLSEPTVSVVATQPGLDYAVSWTVEPDLPFVFLGQEDGTRGGPAPATLRPALNPVSSGRGALSGFTDSSDGVSGRGSAISARGGGSSEVDANEAYLISGFVFLEDETSDVEAAMTSPSCPSVTATTRGVVASTQITLQHFQSQFDAGLQQTVSHGGSYADPNGGASQVAIFTEVPVTPTDAWASAALAWQAGLVYGVHRFRENDPRTSTIWVGILPFFVKAVRTGTRCPGRSWFCLPATRDSTPRWLPLTSTLALGSSSATRTSSTRTTPLTARTRSGKRSWTAATRRPPGTSPPSPTSPMTWRRPPRSSASASPRPSPPGLRTGTSRGGTDGWSFAGTGTGHFGVGSIFVDSIVAPTNGGAAAWGRNQTTAQPYLTMANWSQPFCPPRREHRLRFARLAGRHQSVRVVVLPGHPDDHAGRSGRRERDPELAVRRGLDDLRAAPEPVERDRDDGVAARDVLVRRASRGRPPAGQRDVPRLRMGRGRVLRPRGQRLLERAALIRARRAA